MSHETEYHDSMIKMLELIWGAGYMAPGGTGNVARLFRGIDTAGQRVLDIGCGIGGPALDMVRLHGVEVIGIDLESQLVDRANRDARKVGLSDRATFQTVEPGPLPFAADSFDIVTSSGAITQAPDKKDIFVECMRVLRPGGSVTCYEWMRSDQDYSADMIHWFKMEGLTYALETLEGYGDILRDAGFSNVVTTDASNWYCKEARREYEIIKGELYAEMVALLGQEDADHFVENWRAMVVVCESGEMRQGYFRGSRP